MSKNTILTGGICFLLVFLLLHPAESLSCARAGMTLWLNTLIPTLLPFIILTGMLTHTGHIRKLLLPFESFFHIFPGVSIWGGYVFVLGMLCGYPLGAKLASDLYGLHKISKKKLFISLPSVTIQALPLSLPISVSPVLRIQYLPAWSLRVFFSKSDMYAVLSFFCVPKCHHLRFPGFSPRDFFSKNILDFSIMNGFETITRLGGYILLFSILAGCIRYYAPFPLLYQYLLLGFTEITSGLSLISVSGLPYMTRILLSAAATASGGLCILAQTKGVLHHDLSILPYFISKCICTFLTAGILYCLISYL